MLGLSPLKIPRAQPPIHGTQQVFAFGEVPLPIEYLSRSLGLAGPFQSDLVLSQAAPTAIQYSTHLHCGTRMINSQKAVDPEGAIAT